MCLSSSPAGVRHKNFTDTTHRFQMGPCQPEHMSGAECEQVGSASGRIFSGDPDEDTPLRTIQWPAKTFVSILPNLNLLQLGYAASSPTLQLLELDFQHLMLFYFSKLTTQPTISLFILDFFASPTCSPQGIAINVHRMVSNRVKDSASFLFFECGCM